MNHVTSAALIGIEAVPVSVEADVGRGLPKFLLTGLPDTSIKESKERVRVAMTRSGLTFPGTRITVNLAPADVRKCGALYDLPIVIALMVAQGHIERSALKDAVFVGELSLNGELRPINGALAIALMARKAGKRVLFVPKENAKEASAINELDVIAISHLTELIEHLNNTAPISPMKSDAPKRTQASTVDFSDIKGQELAKRGLEIAAAGGHNVLLKGPPGTGKTLLARAIPSILPALTHEESLEVTVIASIAGLLERRSGLVAERPFRAPHHSCSAVSLVGGGAVPAPGEVSLAHRGVLFLDELAEFSRHVLEHLRGPLEDGDVTIARAAATAKFPARFLLVAAMNPCPCGYATDPKRPCTCPPSFVARYQKKLSGPLMDRFDLIIDVPNIEADTLLARAEGESSERVRGRIETVRKKQAERFSTSDTRTNAEMRPSEIEEVCVLDKESKTLITSAMENQHLSARGYVRVLKVARTIADLAGSDTITPDHLAEALQYRLG